MSPLAENGNRIKTTRCDIRASAGGIRLASRSAVTSLIYGFLQNLLRRYQSRFEGHLRLGLVFRQVRSGVLSTSQRHSHVHLAPRLELTVLSGASATNQPGPKLRLAIRSKRIEASSTSGVSSSLVPVPRVVHRSSSEAFTDGNSLMAGTSIPIRNRQPAATDERVQTDSWPANFNQLTDQVIHAIDRRIIAQRERLGRL